MKAELVARGISQRKLAKSMGRPAGAINGIVTGRKAITPQTALELEEVLGVPAHVWRGWRLTIGLLWQGRKWRWVEKPNEGCCRLGQIRSGPLPRRH